MPMYNIREIDTLSISSDECFFLDANILYRLYTGYPIEEKNDEKVRMYSNFIGELIQNGNKFETSAGNVQEVLNLIERTEHNLYKEANDGQLGKKAFRKNNEQRQLVKNKVRAVYAAIHQNCKIVDLKIEKETLEKFVDTLTEHLYDPMDFFVVEDCVRRERKNVITDDSDFLNDQRLNIYVAR